MRPCMGARIGRCGGQQSLVVLGTAGQHVPDMLGAIVLLSPHA